MNILKAVPGYKLTHNGQVSRRDRYRSELKVTEQDRKDHLDINWNPEQAPSSLVKREGSKYTLSNFRWGFNEVGEAKDWTPRTAETTIDASKVKDVFLCVEPFAPEIVAGHGLLMFEMEDGGVVSADGQKDAGFCLSIEARRPEGEEYGLLTGMKKKFGIIYQMGSLSDRIQKATRGGGQKFVMHRLDLNAEQKEKLVNDGLQASTEDRLGEWYHTLTNSCYTGDIDLINGVVPEEQQMARWSRHLKFARLATALPALGGATIKDKGLLADEPVTFLNPSSELHPGKQASNGGLKGAIGVASRSSLWNPSFKAAGAGLGGAAGWAIGQSFGQIGGIVGAVAGLVTGLYAGDRVADIIAVNTDRKAENAVEWYAAKAGISEQDALTRLSNQPLTAAV